MANAVEVILAAPKKVPEGTKDTGGTDKNGISCKLSFYGGRIYLFWGGILDDFFAKVDGRFRTSLITVENKKTCSKIFEL